ncbi:MAG: DUF2249 domain-containing protein [Planctomycetes bacterium]|nr:DUF2249 domain-containing protein [Planctomycetota bacterium]
MSTSTQELDVRSIPPVRRHPEIFRTFDTLAAGGAFVLVNDHEPRPLLYQFQVERPGQFEWNVLETGPELWRVEIARRREVGSRSVSDFLGTDHRRLDAIAVEVDCLVHAGYFAEAQRRFAEFRCGLDRHIEEEEKVLFPLFEERTGSADGPTAVMRDEHVRIRRGMGQTATAIHDMDREGYAESTRALRELLEEHNRKEEMILYPMTDRLAGGERERDDIVRRMQAMAPEE